MDLRNCFTPAMFLVHIETLHILNKKLNFLTTPQSGFTADFIQRLNSKLTRLDEKGCQVIKNIV